MSHPDEHDERPAKRQRLSPFDAKADDTKQVTTLPEQGGFAITDVSTADSKELDVGITEYASPHTLPFQAVLKKRYTDFMVNEILQDGEVVHLTEVTVPNKLRISGPSKTKNSKQAIPSSIISDEVNGKQDTNGTSNHATDGGSSTLATTISAQEQPQFEPGEISENDKQQLISYLNEAAVDELLALYKSIEQHPNKKPKDHAMVRTDFTNDRALRGEIHRSIRRIFNSKIDSSTDKDGFLCLMAASLHARRAQPNTNNNSNERPAHYPGKLGWLERGGEYLHFTLYKENKDTMEAVGFLVRQMKINTKAFQFAGTKDRRACTAQRLSAFRLDAERLVKQNYHLHNAAVGNFEYKPASLELGELGGNEFVVTLRECVFPGHFETISDDSLSTIQSALEQALTDLFTKGFLNYFGLQRFGTFATRTDTTGLYILKNDFRSACEAILHYTTESLAAAENEPENEAPTPNPAIPHSGLNRDEIARAKSIRLFQKTGNAHKPLEILPRKFSAENQIMRHLARTPADYIGALLNIPRNLRLMYVHAYQSLVWNKAATKRWQLYGSQVVEGDLVLIKEHRDKEFAETETPEIENAGGVDADGEIIIAPSSHDRSNQVEDIFDRARVLTATEAASGHYTIFDIVLPLPGYDILYPANASGQFYKDFMGSDEGGNLDPYDMRRKQKDFSLSGGYRKLMAKIGKDFSVQVKKYQRDEEQFVQTDLEKIRAAKAKDGSAQESKPKAEDTTMADVVPGAAGGDGEQGKDKIAVVLKFQLGASQYATMVLRELSRGGVVPYKADFGGGK